MENLLTRITVKRQKKYKSRFYIYKKKVKKIKSEKINCCGILKRSESCIQFVVVGNFVNSYFDDTCRLDNDRSTTLGRSCLPYCDGGRPV